jgi:hypothetical protein
MRKRTKNVFWLSIAVLFVLTISILYLVHKLDFSNALLTGIVALLLLIGSQIPALANRTKPDERLKRLGAWTMVYSWYTTICAVCVLYLLESFRFALIGTKTALAIVLTTMLASKVGIEAILRRKGDVAD